MRTMILVATVMLIGACCGGPPEGARLQPAADPEGTASSEVARDRVTRELAVELGVGAGELRLVAEERVTWPDASLGCPERGKLYAQVTTPGWRMRFARDDGTAYQVHTDAAANHWVLCEAGRPRPPATRVE